ncbi:MAG: uncharacterized protein H6Q89_1995 [Myxococcaceae bacterium]|nr:uncharacterized protein [Myxococcaceae bacterium]
MRDDVKIGVFHDLAIFAPTLRNERGVELGNGFGPSLHLLVLDMFQIDMYVGVGFRRATQANASFSLILDKAF